MDDEAKKLLDEEIDNSLEDNLGEIHVADEVLCIVASLAAQEVPGVYSMSGGITDEINSFLGKEENASKGVRLKYEGKQVHVIVYVNLEYGYYFPEVALAVQEKVKKAVEDMTNYEVQFVDVHVEGVFKPAVIEHKETGGSADAMAEIMQAQAARAEATEANSYEMQLRQTALGDCEEITKSKASVKPQAHATAVYKQFLEQAVGTKEKLSQQAADIHTKNQDVQHKDESTIERQKAFRHLEDIARAVECEEIAYPERKYFPLGVVDSSVSAEERHRKFWEED